ncbi:MAG: metallophosphoesterase [Treponema sp.]|jgi:predicted MPP superfamily phosphohydrolase|nr:metallophosphoesterase [Treponema sp.]
MNIIFIIFVFVFYSGICVYTGFRFLGFIKFFLPVLNSIIFWILFMLLCYSLIISGFTKSVFLLRRAGIYWMGIILYLLILFILSDIFRLGLFFFGKKIRNFSFFSTAISFVVCICFLIYGIIHAKSLSSVHYRVTIPGQGGELRVALISDLHIGRTIGGKWVSKIVDHINSADIDMVLIPGDVFDGSIDMVRDLQDVLNQLKRIQAPLGVYACPGNHDTDRTFKGGTERIAESLKSAGVIFMQDDVYAIRDNLYIIGRKDARPIGMESNRKSASELCAGLDGTIVMLDHQPVDFLREEDAGISLVLSGHTHAGQIFPANLITRVIYKKAGAVHYGYWKGKNMQAIVTSGAGFWGPPMRIASNNEVAFIDIVFDQ